MTNSLLCVNLEKHVNGLHIDEEKSPVLIWKTMLMYHYQYWFLTEPITMPKHVNMLPADAKIKVRRKKRSNPDTSSSSDKKTHAGQKVSGKVEYIGKERRKG